MTALFCAEKCFGALNLIEFNVSSSAPPVDGEFVVIVGPSGCGKSTLLRMIAGLEDITQGTLEIDGVRMNDRQPKDRGIAMVFQTYAIFPHMTVRENVAFGLTINKSLEKSNPEPLYLFITQKATSAPFQSIFPR